MQERANEMTNSRHLRQEILLLVSGASFLSTAPSERQDVLLQRERLPALLGWIFWKILCNNGLFATAAYIEQHSASHMGCGHEVYCMV